MKCHCAKCHSVRVAGTSTIRGIIGILSLFMSIVMQVGYLILTEGQLLEQLFFLDLI